MAIAELVGWCPSCETYVSPYKPGESCPVYGYDDSCRTKSLHKRRMFICPDPSGCEASGFFDREVYSRHLEAYHQDDGRE